MTQLTLGLTCGGALRPLLHGEAGFPCRCYGLGLVLDGQVVTSWRFLGQMPWDTIDIFPSGPRRGGYSLCLIGRQLWSKLHNNNMVAPFLYQHGIQASGITRLGSATTLRDELISAGEDHIDLSLGFSDMMTWGTLPVWQDVQQEEVKGNTCKQGFISTGIGLHLQESTPEVHEIVYLGEKFFEGLPNILHFQGAISVHRASGDFDLWDSECSEGGLPRVTMVWDPSIMGFIHAVVVPHRGLVQWHNWYLGAASHSDIT